MYNKTFLLRESLLNLLQADDANVYTKLNKHIASIAEKCLIRTTNPDEAEDLIECKQHEEYAIALLEKIKEFPVVFINPHRFAWRDMKIFIQNLPMY